MIYSKLNGQIKQKNIYNYYRAFMVLSFRSQIRQITERFFLQSGFFKIYHHTRYGMDKFSSSGLRLRYMENDIFKLNKTPLTYIGDRVDCC